MRKIGLSLLAGSLVAVAGAAPAQQDAAPSPDEFVCALAGDCEEEAADDEDGSEPRLSATRGFALSRPGAPRAEPRTGRSRPARQTGRVDLRLGFASGSADLSPADQVRVQAFAEALKRPQLANLRIRIEGHTDSSGGRAVNLGLSQRRAQAVADYLVGQGIAAERLEVRGYGYDRPLPGRPASAGENRRVEAVRIS